MYKSKIPLSQDVSKQSVFLSMGPTYAGEYSFDGEMPIAGSLSSVKAMKKGSGSSGSVFLFLGISLLDISMIYIYYRKPKNLS